MQMPRNADKPSRHQRAIALHQRHPNRPQADLVMARQISAEIAHQLLGRCFRWVEPPPVFEFPCAFGPYGPIIPNA